MKENYDILRTWLNERTQKPWIQLIVNGQMALCMVFKSGYQALQPEGFIGYREHVPLLSFEPAE
jgi:hypothetical protein